MNTEILKDILSFTEDKQNTIVYFLKPNIQNLLLNYYYYDHSDNDIFIDQHIVLIKKNNLHLEDKGFIISINRNRIGVSVNNLFNRYYNINDYYVFLKNKQSRTSERDLLESLLKKL